jgi:hypothetical protein
VPPPAARPSFWGGPLFGTSRIGHLGLDACPNATFTQGGIPANFQAEFTKTVLSKDSTAPSTEPANTPSAVPTKPVP